MLKGIGLRRHVLSTVFGSSGLIKRQISYITCPILPHPTMPNVLPLSSTPLKGFLYAEECSIVEISYESFACQQNVHSSTEAADAL